MRRSRSGGPYGNRGNDDSYSDGAGRFKIILKKCKIHVELIIIMKIEPKRKKY